MGPLLLFPSKVQEGCCQARLPENFRIQHAAFRYLGLTLEEYMPVLFPVIHGIGVMIKDMLCAYFLYDPFCMGSL